MPNDLDAKLDAMLDGDEAEPSAEPEAQPESTPAPEVKFAELDAVYPDDPSIPEAYRGKAITDVVRVAEQHKYEAGVAATRNQEWKKMQAERDAANLALRFFQQERAQQQAPQIPTESHDEYLQRLAMQPREVIGEQMREEMRPIVDQLRQTQEDLFRARADQAQSVARARLGIPDDVWGEISGDVGTFMAYNNWPVNNPDAWSEATRRHLDRSIRIAQRFAPQPAAQTAPVEVPRGAAPPNGTARSTSRPTAQVRLKPALRQQLDDIAEAAGLDPKRKASLEKFAAENAGGLS